MKYIYLIAYVASVLVANLLLDHFIELPFFGMLSYGTIFFAFVFTLRDHLHRYSLNFALSGIALALVVNTICAFYFDIPWRFLLASFLAILFSELMNTGVFEKLKQHSWHIRVLASNAASVPIDSTLFTFIAFYGIFELPMMAEIIFADIIAKLLIASTIISKVFIIKPKNNDSTTLSTHSIILTDYEKTYD